MRIRANPEVQEASHNADLDPPHRLHVLYVYRDGELGHSAGSGWRLILVNWLGSLAVISVIIRHMPALSVPVPDHLARSVILVSSS